MTTETDTLSRPPIMKPIERKEIDERKPFETEVHGDRQTVFVPRTLMSISGVAASTPTPVTLPRPAWEA